MSTAMIVATVPEVATERHEGATVQKRQCAALILSSQVETNAVRGKFGSLIASCYWSEDRSQKW
jgi:hypothetical protein